MSERTAQGRIPELDGLRGIAILLVVLVHYVNEATGGPLGSTLSRFQRLFSLCWSGVDLFFVLSGFLIGGILLQVRESPNYFKTFYARRFFRIVPLYYGWIFLYAVVALAGAYPRSIGPAPILGLPLYSYLLFFQNVHFGAYPSTLVGGWFTPTWSLAVEEQFYLFAPFLVWKLSNRKLLTLLITVIALAPLVRMILHFYVPSGPFLAYSLTPSRADDLAMGIVVALMWRSAACRSWLSARLGRLRGVGVILLAGTAVLWRWSTNLFSVAMQSIGFTWIALLFATILLLVLVEPRGMVGAVARTTWLRELGRVSYCVYIIHVAVSMFCHRLLLHADPSIANLQAVGVSLFAFALTLVLAQLSWRFFEEPLLRRGHTIKY
jgi:peptidoglycan/LPS O-acetylase OafA/YrhL